MRTLEHDEKSEDIGDTGIRESFFCDSEGLASVSVTAEEVAVMADFSDHSKKKEGKKKSKKKSTRKRSTKSNEQTDVEGEEVKLSSEKRKKKHSKRKNRTKEGYNEAISGSEKQKSKKEKGTEKLSKKKKKKKSAKSTDNNDDDDIHNEDDFFTIVHSSNQVNTIEGEDEDKTTDHVDFPPELNSGSSSSELPDPGDLETDESSDDESDIAASNIDYPKIEAASLLAEGTDALPLDYGVNTLSKKSLCSLSLPPQAIPGSIANEIVDSTPEHYGRTVRKHKR